ncbi:MAG: hypothetical protein JSS28_03320 [Proteobacteria bacterium]|nr:hypothetical protein [Pseudomonadota bacterium]
MRAVLCLLSLAPVAAFACAGRVHIEVKDSGVYALDYASIVAVQPGLADCPVDELVLSNRNDEVPIRVLGAPQGRFGPGSRIEWLGQMLHGPESWFDPYSTVNVYLLGAAPGPHARVRVLAAPDAALAPAPLVRHVHYEQENLLLRLSDSEMKPGEEPDFWQWAKLTPIDPAPFTLAFDLPDLAASARDATLTVNLRGVSSVLPVKGQAKPVDHRVDVALNGKPLQILEWDGRGEFRRDLHLDPGLLKAKGNVLTLRVVKRPLAGNPDGFIVDVAMVNWLAVAYPVRGAIDADASAFRAVGTGPVDLQYRGTGAPEVLGSDGALRSARSIGKGRYRFAGAGAAVDLYPALEGHAMRPVSVRAVATRDLRAADPGFDYLIVAHPTLLDAIAPLARYHAQHGHRVDLVNADGIYDAFNGGIAHPRAIRDFVAWGATHWPIKPRYLLLVGDASTAIHHDPTHGRLGTSSYLMTPDPLGSQILAGSGFGGMTSYAYPEAANQLATRNLVPTWQYPTAEGQGASDNPYATLRQGDFHPTLAVGRLPVVTPDEVKAIVDKTLAYLEHPAPGQWRRAMTFVSTSEVASFKSESDKIAQSLDREGFATTSIYTDFHDKSREHYEQARTALRRDLDAGSLLVHFLGHGGSYIWRVGPMGDLFSLDDVSHLSNAGRYPMVLAMTCFSAPFDNPSDDSIGERFLREADKGAVAVFAASWKNSPNPTYSKMLIDELLKPGKTIGDAIVAAKARIADRDFVETYNLLGDPALVLARPQGDLQLARAYGRWDRQVVVRIPRSDFGGDVYADWIDANGAIVQSRHYQARDTLFSLPVLDKAVTLSVYTVDGRDGYTAAGGVSLLPPPRPKPRIAVRSGRTNGPVRPRPPRAADAISRMGFEDGDDATK